MIFFFNCLAKVHLFDLVRRLVKCKMYMGRWGGCSQEHGSYSKSLRRVLSIL